METGVPVRSDILCETLCTSLEVELMETSISTVEDIPLTLCTSLEVELMETRAGQPGWTGSPHLCTSLEVELMETLIHNESSSLLGRGFALLWKWN